MATHAILKAFIHAVLAEHPHLTDSVISNLDSQQKQADRILNGAALVSFSERLQGVKKGLLSA